MTEITPRILAAYYQIRASNIKAGLTLEEYRRFHRPISHIEPLEKITLQRVTDCIREEIDIANLQILYNKLEIMSLKNERDRNERLLRRYQKTYGHLPENK